MPCQLFGHPVDGDGDGLLQVHCIAMVCYRFSVSVSCLGDDKVGDGKGKQET